MKKAVKIGLVFVLMVIMLTSNTVPCFAGEPSRKLPRGIGNILFGWLEIPMWPYKRSQEKGALYGTTVGLIEGAGMAVFRTVVGVYEVPTFFIPLPDDFGPIIEPEFIIDAPGS